MTVTALSIPNYKLKLHSKKLQSGRFQVKFYASQQQTQQQIQQLTQAEALKSVANQLPIKEELHDTKEEHKEEHQELYGYVLVDAKDTLKQVVNTINQRLHLMEEANDYYHTHLYAVRKEPMPSSEFMIFKS